MRIRYSAAENGRPIKKAVVYTKDEHHIDKRAVDGDALRIVERLKANGHSAYIVGGAVRDLLVAKRPKDFDIVTDATPTRIKRVFRNSRIIGRRFRLVHVFFGPVIYEVSTFRSLKDGTVSNTFGTIEEDVLRRDFSCNALYYDPSEETVVDYVGGVADLKKRRIVPVIPLKNIFLDDPVRMLRAAKYAATTGCSLPLLVRWKIKRQAPLLEPVSPSRLTEEIIKILRSGKAASIVESLDSLGLFRYLQPNAARLMRENSAYRGRLRSSLDAMDAEAKKDGEASLGRLLSFMLKDFVDLEAKKGGDPTEAYRDALTLCRAFVLPMNPPRIELEAAVRAIFKEMGLPVKKSRFSERVRRGSDPDKEGDAPKGRRGPAPASVAAPAEDAGEGAPSGASEGPDGPKRKRRRRRRRKAPGAAGDASPDSGPAGED